MASVQDAIKNASNIENNFDIMELYWLTRQIYEINPDIDLDEVTRITQVTMTSIAKRYAKKQKRLKPVTIGALVSETPWIEWMKSIKKNPVKKQTNVDDAASASKSETPSKKRDKPTKKQTNVDDAVSASKSETPSKKRDNSKHSTNPPKKKKVKVKTPPKTTVAPSFEPRLQQTPVYDKSFYRPFTATRDITREDADDVLEFCQKHLKVKRRNGRLQFCRHLGKYVEVHGGPDIRFLFNSDYKNPISPEKVCFEFTPNKPCIHVANRISLRFRSVHESDEFDKIEARIITLAFVKICELLPYFNDFI